MRGHVQEIAPGTFRIYGPAGRDPINGHRRTVSETVHGTRTQAERALSRLLVKIDEGRAGTAVETFGGLVDRWLTQIGSSRSPKTMHEYRSKIENHIRPALGSLPLRKLTGAYLDDFYHQLLERGRKNGRGGLSARTVHHIHSIIHAACAQGYRWEWLDRNPADRATPPSPQDLDRPAPSIGDVLKVLDELTVDLRELAVLATVTGARAGELCGLQWADLKLDEDDSGALGAQLTISRAIAALSGEPVVKATKTRQVRRLAVDDVTVAMLGARRAREAQKALACGVPLGPAGFMFADLPGGQPPLNPQQVSSRWRYARRRAGVDCTFHDLRHFSITELLEAGFEIGMVSKRHGHSKTSITQDRYQHARRSGDRAAAEHLSKLVQGG